MTAQCTTPCSALHIFHSWYKVMLKYLEKGKRCTLFTVKRHGPRLRHTCKYMHKEWKQITKFNERTNEWMNEWTNQRTNQRERTNAYEMGPQCIWRTTMTIIVYWLRVYMFVWMWMRIKVIMLSICRTSKSQNTLWPGLHANANRDDGKHEQDEWSKSFWTKSKC